VDNPSKEFMFSMMSDNNFKSLFCERFRCAPDEYEPRVFGKCLYFHARLLAPLARLLSPSIFVEDVKFVRVLGRATDLEDARIDVANFKDSNRWVKGTLRRQFKIRVSGKKAMNLACEMLRKPGQSQGPETAKPL